MWEKHSIAMVGYDQGTKAPYGCLNEKKSLGTAVRLVLNRLRFKHRCMYISMTSTHFVTLHYKLVVSVWSWVIWQFFVAGHGKSEGTRVDIKDFQHYVDDLLQFVDIIKKEHSDIPLFIMGHSMVRLLCFWQCCWVYSCWQVICNHQRVSKSLVTIVYSNLSPE